MRIDFRSSLSIAALALGFTGCSMYGQSMPQNFVAVTPCRLADTRISQGGSGPIPSATYQNFTIAGKCGIPSNASAYSLNVTAVPPGSLLFLSVLPAPATTPPNPPSSSTLNDPSGTIIANAALVPAGVNGAVTVFVSNTSDVILDTDGYFVNQTAQGSSNTAVGTGALTGGTGTQNTAVGFNALQSPSGSFNTATGFQSLQEDSTGADNTAYGYQALLNNTSGADNTAVGFNAIINLFNGGGNTALGSQAGAGLQQGGKNVAIGFQALRGGDASSVTAVGAHTLQNVSFGADFNTAFGFQALESVTSGLSNIGLGPSAGSSVTSGSHNIEIGNTGSSSDNGLIRIGTGGTQTSTFISGISGVTVTGAAVLVNANGQLGVQSSSIRYKEDVHDMADGSNALMALRPVEFRYREAEADGSKPLQFGLIAEEVAKVYPELVVRDKNGNVDAVQYHQLPALLLNEVQKQHRTIGDQEQEIRDLKAEIESLKIAIKGK